MIEMETKLKGRKHFAGRELLMNFLKNLFISDFGTKRRSTLMNLIRDTRQEDRIPYRRKKWIFRNNKIRKSVTQLGNNVTKWRGNSKRYDRTRFTC